MLARVRNRAPAAGETTLPGTTRIAGSSSPSLSATSAHASARPSPSPPHEEPLAQRVNTVFEVTQAHARLLSEIVRAGERARASQASAAKDARALNALLQQYATRVRANQQTVITLSSGQRGLTVTGIKGCLQSDAAVAGVFDCDDDALQSSAIVQREGPGQSESVGTVADVVRANEAVASSLENTARLSQHMLDGHQRLSDVINDALVSRAAGFIQSELAEAKAQRKKFDRAKGRYESSSSSLKSAQASKRANPKKLQDAQTERSRTHADFLAAGDGAVRSLDFTNKACESLVLDSMSAIITEIGDIVRQGSTQVDGVLAVMQDYKDAAAILDKQREARRSRVTSSRRNTVRSLGLSIFGATIQDIVKREHRPVPIILEVLCTWLLENASETEGVFRVNASINQVNDVKQELNQALDFDQMSEIVRHKLKQRTGGRDGHVHLCANLLKIFLRELPEPLLTNSLYDRLVACWDVSNEEQRLQDIESLCNDLPLVNARSVAYVLSVCAFLVEHAERTKMNPKNLATVMSPNLLAPREQNSNPGAMMKEMEASSGIIEIMIKHAPRLCLSLSDKSVASRVNPLPAMQTRTDVAKPNAPPVLPPRKKDDTPALPPKRKDETGTTGTSAVPASFLSEDSALADEHVVAQIDESFHVLCEQLYLLVRALFEGDDLQRALSAHEICEFIVAPDLAPRVRDMALAVKDLSSCARQSVDSELREAARGLQTAMADIIKALQSLAAAQASLSADSTIAERLVRAVTQFIRASAQLSGMLQATHRRLLSNDIHRIIQLIVKHTASTLRALLSAQSDDASTLLGEIEQMIENDLRKEVQHVLVYLPARCSLEARIKQESETLERSAREWIQSLRVRIAKCPGNGDRQVLAAEAKELVHAFRTFSNILGEARTVRSFDVELDSDQFNLEALDIIKLASTRVSAGAADSLRSLQQTWTANVSEKTFDSAGHFASAIVVFGDSILESDRDGARLNDILAGFSNMLRLQACLNFVGVDVGSAIIGPGQLVLSLASLVAQCCP